MHRGYRLNDCPWEPCSGDTEFPLVDGFRIPTAVDLCAGVTGCICVTGDVWGV